MDTIALAAVADFCDKSNKGFTYKKNGFTMNDRDNVIFSALGSVGWEYVTEKEQDKTKGEGFSLVIQRVIFRKQIS